MEAQLNLKGAGIWNGERAEFEAYLDAPAAAMEGGSTTVRLALASKRATLGFDGDVQVDPAAALPLVNGKMEVDLPDPAAAVAWASGTAAPAGMADLGAVKLDGSASATEAALKLGAKGSAGYKGAARWASS